MPKVSVCIATYNGEAFIQEQLLSILNQLKVGDEVIISDDGSTDKTLEIIDGFCDSRIQIVKGNYKDPIFNFENAIKTTKGDIIFLSDQDDVWLPSKVEIMVKSIRDADVVVSDCVVVDRNLNQLYDSFFEINNSGPGILRNLKRNSYLGCCMAFRKEVKNMILPFPKRIPMHDIWIGFVSEFFFKAKFIDDKLIMYRRHGNNESPTAETSPYSLWNKLKFRLKLFIRLPDLIRKRYLSQFKKTGISNQV